MFHDLVDFTFFLWYSVTKNFIFKKIICEKELFYLLADR